MGWEKNKEQENSENNRGNKKAQEDNLRQDIGRVSLLIQWCSHPPHTVLMNFGLRDVSFIFSRILAIWAITVLLLSRHFSPHTASNNSSDDTTFPLLQQVNNWRQQSASYHPQIPGLVYSFYTIYLVHFPAIVTYLSFLTRHFMQFLAQHPFMTKRSSWPKLWDKGYLYNRKTTIMYNSSGWAP